MTKKLVRTTKTITFSLPSEMAEQVQEVMREEGRTMSDLIPEAPATTWKSTSCCGPSDTRGSALAMPNRKIQ